MTEPADPPVLVAIDGPAGSGKSSVSREVARRLGFGYLDTGAAYRAVTWAVLARGADPGDADAAAACAGTDAASGGWDVSLDPDRRDVRVGDVDVAAGIRTDRVTAAVSRVARVAEVRRILTSRFRELVASSGRPGVVVEGRDITTVVAPDAAVRILLTASPAARAARRGAELDDHAAGAIRDRGEVARDLERRDTADSAVAAFTDAAPGVAVVDSTDLDFDQTVAAVLAEVTQRTGALDGR